MQTSYTLAMDKERFSLLLLEPNEIYFEDFLVSLLTEEQIESGAETPINDGHLKMCSKSIVFDPKDRMSPILKIQYRDCDNVYQWPVPLKSKYVNVLAVSCTQYSEMLNDNILAPYNFKSERRVFLFHLHYAKVENHLRQFCQLHRAGSLSAFEQNDMIATIVYSRCKRMKFNPLWLDDIYEKIIVQHTVDEIKPLIMNPGQLLLSSNAIYFQPYNNIQRYPVKKIPLSKVTTMIRRRFLLRHISLEIKWIDESGPKEETLYVAFKKTNERDNFYKLACEQNSLNLVESEQHSMTLKWQNGIISNYDYLLYLNSLADRTFQDLTQYPVFPWVINDYACTDLDLNDDRVYRDLRKPMGFFFRFIYGSHYSAPGLVLFYLVRKYPQLMLCLQNGRFDHPDRMFNSVRDAHKNCLTNMSDFKELVPEFYDPSQGGEFLLNLSKTNFGCRQDGTCVNHVQLPPWANNSAERFIQIMRNALESEYVSRNLNHWIDLVFGCKQRGEAALKADNLFYHLCYEGSVDLDAISELTERHMLEVQISEFGQIPKQLFDKPHVSKLTGRTTQVPETSTSAATQHGNPAAQRTQTLCEIGQPTNDSSVCDIIHELTFYDDGQTHKDIVTGVMFDGNGVILSVGKDGLLKCYKVADRRQTRCVTIGQLPLSCCARIQSANTIILGSWDNTIMSYDLDYGRISIVLPAHDDAVSCLKIINEIGVVVSGSWDCSVKVWKGFDAINSFRLSDSMLAYLPFEEKISALDCHLHNDILQIAIGTFAGEVHLWTLLILDETKTIVQEPETVRSKLLHHHRPGTEVLAVAFNCNGTKITSCALDGTLNVCDIGSGMTLVSRQHSSAFTCLDWSYSDECLVLGDQVGHVFVLNMLTGSMHSELAAFDGCTTAICVSKAENKLAVGGINGREYLLKIWDCSTASARDFL